MRFHYHQNHLNYLKSTAAERRVCIRIISPVPSKCTFYPYTNKWIERKGNRRPLQIGENKYNLFENHILMDILFPMCLLYARSQHRIYRNAYR